VVIIVIAYIVNSYILAIISVIIFHVGWIILGTFEYGIRREIYYRTTFVERLVGDIPQIIDRKAFPTIYPKTIGIITGIMCFLTAFISYARLKTFSTTDMVFMGILLFWGIFFIIFSLLRNNKA